MLLICLVVEGAEYSDAIRLLRLLDNSTNLLDIIKLDIEAEDIEEGARVEGNVQFYYGKRYERNPINREIAIKKHGISCYVCSFNFEEMYGKHGRGFIEVHHITPLSLLNEETKVNPETDLIPLCPNCHRMVHRKKLIS